MEQGYEVSRWLDTMTAMIRKGRYSCFSGSALQNVGVSHFLHQLDLLTVSDYDPALILPEGYIRFAMTNRAQD